MPFLKTPEEVKLAFDLRHITALELIDAVAELLDETPELWGEEALAEIVGISRKQTSVVERAPHLLRSYLAANPMRPTQRPRSLEDCGKAVLKARLERYIDSEDLPFTVCRMVSPLEHMFDYPKWLGDLYNVCDWCDERATREHFSWVRVEAERLVQVL